MFGDRVVIHIGYHRTGSTLLQDHVFPAMALNLVRKPRAGYILHGADFDPQRFRSDIAQGLAIDPARPTMITHEILSGAPEGGPRERRLRTATRLAEAFPDAKILVVIRRQFDFVLSIYAYRVLIRGTERRSLDQYLADHEVELLSSLEYDDLIGTYIDQFGAERIRVIPFEQLGESPEAFVGNIAGFVGVPTPDLQLRRINESTRSERIIEINRLLNAPIDLTLGILRRRGAQRLYTRVARPYFELKDRVLNPWLRKRAGTRALELPLEWTQRVTPRLAASNRRLEALTGLDLARYGYLR